MQANLVTLIRIFLVFLVIGLYKVNTIACGIAVLLTIATLYMDALDGIIARRLGHRIRSRRNVRHRRGSHRRERLLGLFCVDRHGQRLGCGHRRRSEFSHRLAANARLCGRGPDPHSAVRP